MRNLFFFGTLRHTPLLEVVLSGAIGRLVIEDGRLPGYRVDAVAGEPFPMISEDPDATADGVVVRGLSQDDVARLDFYEGSFAYDLQPVVLKGGTPAEVYVPRPGIWQGDGPWSLEDWVATHGEMSVIAAREVMGYYGTLSARDVAARFPLIRARAASRVRAQASRHGSDAFRGTVEIVSAERRYDGFYALDDLVLRHARFDGSVSAALERAVFVKADAAFVLPYDPQRDCVLVVEQVRVGAIGRGDRTCWHMEPIAGGIDAGETPEAAARREAREEAGIEIGAMEPIGEVYPTSGSATDFFYFFLGIADLPETVTGQGGLATEDEDIRSHIWSFDELMDRVARFDIANAALLTSAYYLAAHRDRLRSEGARDTPRGT